MMPSFRHAQTIRWSVALITFLVATVSLLYGPSHIEYPAPLIIHHASAVIDSLILASTFYASIGLIIGRRSAWRSAIVVLTLAVVWETLESRAPISILSLYPLLALLAVLATHRYYPIATHHAVISYTLRRALIFTLATTAIGCLAFFILASFEHRTFSIETIVIRALEQMYSPYDIFEPLRHPSISHAAGRGLLFILGVVNYTTIAFALLRPVADSFQLTPLAHSRALQLLHRFGTSSEDYFKYFPADKSYYFGEAVAGMIAYGAYEGTCIALANPIAASSEHRRILVDEFVNFCRSSGWHAVFLDVESEHLSLYNEHDLNRLKIGETARVSLATIASLKAKKNNRNILNRFAKAGFSTELLSPHHQPALLKELQAVSDAWLTREGRSERQFVMGYFDKNYLQHCQLFLVRDSARRIVAFANLQPNFSSHTRASIDLMRALPEAPSNTMDFLFLSLMDQLSREGWQDFELGLAPLSGLEKGQVSERGLHLLYTYTERWFSFKGLRRFKEKFSPAWHPVYLLYSGPPSRLVAISVAINELMKYRD